MTSQLTHHVFQRYDDGHDIFNHILFHNLKEIHNKIISTTFQINIYIYINVLDLSQLIVAQ